MHEGEKKKDDRRKDVYEREGRKGKRENGQHEKQVMRQKIKTAVETTLDKNPKTVYHISKREGVKEGK